MRIHDVEINMCVYVHKKLFTKYRLDDLLPPRPAAAAAAAAATACPFVTLDFQVKPSGVVDGRGEMLGQRWGGGRGSERRREMESPPHISSTMNATPFSLSFVILLHLREGWRRRRRRRRKCQVITPTHFQFHIKTKICF